MEFKNKLKFRLYLAIAYIVAGVTMIVVFNTIKNGNEFFSAYGLALVVIGFARIRRYCRITKNEETVRKQEILETDERNVAIVNKARSTAFYVFVLLLSLVIVVLQFLNLRVYVQVLAGVLCTLLVIYWICYLIIRKRL